MPKPGSGEPSSWEWEERKDRSRSSVKMFLMAAVYLTNQECYQNKLREVKGKRQGKSEFGMRNWGLGIGIGKFFVRSIKKPPCSLRLCGYPLQRQNTEAMLCKKNKKLKTINQKPH
jgi:hypothetical protein